MDNVVVKSEPMEPVNMKRKHSPDVPIAAKKVQFRYNADMSKDSQMLLFLKSTCSLPTVKFPYFSWTQI